MDKIWTVPEVAAYLKMSKSKLYNLIQRDDIPHIKIGKNIRILESDLMEWLEDQKRPLKQLELKFLD